MAAVYVDEEEIWKCQKHPSKRRRSGICPMCLRDHLKSLCPECGNVRPCSCCAITTSSSSSSFSFFSFSRFSASGRENFGSGTRTVGLVNNLIQSEPEFRRSRSVSVPFLRSKSKFIERVDTVGNEVNHESSSGKTTTSSSLFWSWLKGGNNNHTNGKIKRGGDVEDERRVMMRKSRSVADYGKPKGGKWYFPSPIKVFRQSRLAKVVVQERSPMYRG